MDHKKGGGSSSSCSQDVEVRKGPWTMEEDLILINYIATHGEGVWNSLAKAAGLKRTGKSCRLRWLNYLRPDVRRGNITPEEQLLIMELHAKWGNRWSKIAKHLPGRTDNEIKNFWRTRIQKQLKQSTNTMLNRSLNISSSSGNPGGVDHQMDSPVDLHHQYGSDQKAPSTSQMSTSAASPTCCMNAPDSYSVSSYGHEQQQQQQQPMEGYPMVSGLGGGSSSAGGYYGGGGGVGGGYVYSGFPQSTGNSSTPASFGNNNNCPTGVEGSDNFWSMEELWSMQFFNGD